MSFDPVSMIVEAFSEGVVAATKDTATELAKEGFANLKDLIVRKFGNTGDVSEALANVENKPDSKSRRGVLKEELEESGAGQDTELQEQAKILLEFLGKAGSSYNAEAYEYSTIVQGNKNITATHGSLAVGGDIHGDVYVGTPAKNPKEALNIYRKVLFHSTGVLPLRGIDVEASDPTRSRKCLDLAQVYIDLDTQTQVSVDEEGKQKSKRKELLDREKTRPLSLLEAAAQNRRLVILGDPGSGKTTFLNHLAHCLAGYGLDSQEGWRQRLSAWPEKETGIIPIQVVLRDFARWLPQKAKHGETGHLWNFVAQRLTNQNLAPTIDPLLKELDEGNVLLMLDGLDEIPEQRQRTLVHESVHAFADRYRNIRMMVTCRTLSYEETPEWRLENFPEFRVASLNEEQIDGFVTAWYRELTRLGRIKSDSASESAAQFQRAIRNSKLMELARNPLLLTVMALVHTHKGRLPEARALLYEETVDILLSHWEEIKTDGKQETPRLRALLQEAGRTDLDLKRALWNVAYQAHKDGGAGDDQVADIGELLLEKTLAKLHPTGNRDWAWQLIQTMKLRAGLLLERKPEVFSFPHRTFQEYLAGAYLSSQSGFARQARELITEGAVWREAILLAVGRLVYLSGDIDKPIALVGELCPDREPTDEVGWRGVWIAGEILVEMGLNRVNESSLGQELAVRVRNRLAALLQGGKLTPVERAAAGRALAKLGDPRFREDAWYVPNEPLLGFVEIPAGPFLMGEDKIEVTVPTFYISRYPVTVAQFQAFVEAGGYAEPRYWPEAKAAGVWGEGAVKAWEDNQPRNCPACFGEPFDLANHPVVGVTWYEALAYCRWLTDQLPKGESTPEPLANLLRKNNWKVLLPGETQWEKAARGCDGRIYPWGEKFDAERANCKESGVGATCAVGGFPSGASPFGVMDMSGNVWEWCVSKWREDFKADQENNSTEGEAGRVLRGGSFYNDGRNLRCSCCGGGTPDARYGLIGFRLVLAPESFAEL